jgi:hypothetical protein
MNTCMECSIFMCNDCSYTSDLFDCAECMTGLEWSSSMMMCLAPPVVCMDNCNICTDDATCDTCNIGFVYNTDGASPVCKMDSSCVAG